MPIRHMPLTPLGRWHSHPLVNNTVCRGRGAAERWWRTHTHRGIAAARRRNTHALHGCTHNTNDRRPALLSARGGSCHRRPRLVKRVEHKTQTAGGIYLPTEQKVNEADVVATSGNVRTTAGSSSPWRSPSATPCCPSTARRPSTSARRSTSARKDILGKFRGLILFPRINRWCS